MTTCATCRLFTPPDQRAEIMWQAWGKARGVEDSAPGFCPRTFARENGGIRPTRGTDNACGMYETADGANPPERPQQGNLLDITDV